MSFAAIFQGTAAPEHVDVLKTSVRILENESRTQPGTIRYEFYESNADPLVIMLFAVWESEADWKAHLASNAHIRHVESLPEGAWAIMPQMTRWERLDG